MTADDIDRVTDEIPARFFAEGRSVHEAVAAMAARIAELERPPYLGVALRDAMDRVHAAEARILELEAQLRGAREPAGREGQALPPWEREARMIEHEVRLKVQRGEIDDAVWLAGRASELRARAQEAPLSAAERARFRPANYSALPPSEQWEIDKRLGLLDWDGKEGGT